MFLISSGKPAAIGESAVVFLALERKQHCSCATTVFENSSAVCRAAASFSRCASVGTSMLGAVCGSPPPFTGVWLKNARE